MRFKGGLGFHAPCHPESRIFSRSGRMRPNPVVFAALFGAASAHAGGNFTVTDTGDAGDGNCDATCTLRDAIDDATNGDRIDFDATLPAPILITLTGAPLQVDTDLRITGIDGQVITLRRANGDSQRLMNATATADARLIGLGFENGVHAPSGTVAQGGALLVEAGATLELRDCVFRNNRAFGSVVPFGAGTEAQGGAIFSRGTLLLENCAFVGNRAIGGTGSMGVSNAWTGGLASGGAVHSEGTLDIVNTTFSGNRAEGGVGGPAPPGGAVGLPGGNGGIGMGGAISTTSGSSTSIGFSTLFENSVDGGVGGPGGIGTPPGSPGAPGVAYGAATIVQGPIAINASLLAANAGGNFPCGGSGVYSVRTSNLTDTGGCPGTVVADLITQFEAIDVAADSPHYKPLYTSAAVDTLPDCNDVPALEAVDIDQLIAPRPMAGNGTLACDHGAIELSPTLFTDGFEEPPPPP
jgi:CSLREA domain-containing protein